MLYLCVGKYSYVITESDPIIRILSKDPVSFKTNQLDSKFTCGITRC